jgi:hypothetical protein
MKLDEQEIREHAHDLAGRYLLFNIDLMVRDEFPDADDYEMESGAFFEYRLLFLQALKQEIRAIAKGLLAQAQSIHNE